MIVLTRDKPREYEVGSVNEFGILPGIIYEGAAVGDNGEGRARSLMAGDKFLGFCEQITRGETVRVKSNGLIQLPVAGVTHASFGVPVYASGEDTFTLIATDNSLIGKIYRVLANDHAIVAFNSLS